MPTDQQGIWNIISNIRNSAPEHDGISLKVTNHVIELLLPPLTYMINVSFREVVFHFKHEIAQDLSLNKTTIRNS